MKFKLFLLGLLILSCSTSIKYRNSEPFIAPTVLPTQTVQATEAAAPDSTEQIVVETNTPIPTPTRVEDPYVIFGSLNLNDPSSKLEISIVWRCRSSDNSVVVRTTPAALTNDSDISAIFNGASASSRNTSANWSYIPENPNSDIAHYVHSGWYIRTFRNPAERLRAFLESGGESHAPLNELTLNQINGRLDCLDSADITIEQNSNVVSGLTVLEAIRIPVNRVEEFNSTIIPELNPFLYDNQEQLILVFCGWRHVEEVGVAGTLDNVPGSYVWSRYVIVIGEKN